VRLVLAVLVLLVAVPAASARNVVLVDGEQFLVAGSHVACAVDWTSGAGHVVCFIQRTPLGNPPRGSFGLDVNSRFAAVFRYPGGTLHPKAVAHGLQPTTVPRDVAARKGSSRHTIVLHVGDGASIAGTALLALVRKGKTGIGVVVAPIANTGDSVVGAYTAALNDRRVVLARFTNTKGGSKIVYRRG
jgi:hypothetical protein